MPITDAERAMLARIERGGPDGRAAFRELVEAHQAWLVRYLHYLLHDAGLAEDIAQDTFVRAHERLHTFRGDAPVRAWLRQIATRLAFNHRRDATTRRRYEQQAEQPRYAPALDAAVEAREGLLASLSRLSYPYREILVLRYVEELSVGAISAALGISLPATKMRLSRARAAFRDSHAELTDD